MRTVALTIDYIGPVAVGDELTASPQVLRVGKRLAQATTIVFARGVPVARASATLAIVGRLPDDT